MARSPRPQLPGGLYHLTTRANRGALAYADAYDCSHFITVFARTVGRHTWRCHAYCLMPTHYHLLVETIEPNLSQGMQYLNGRYALDFNRRHGLEGHLFERRFRCVVVENEGHLLELSRYIVLNPVRAGLCDDPKAWVWSSYRAMVSLEPAPGFLTVPWLRDQFSVAGRGGAALFADFVTGGVRNGHDPRLAPDVGGWDLSRR
jgi:putative transposase